MLDKLDFRRRKINHQFLLLFFAGYLVIITIYVATITLTSKCTLTLIASSPLPATRMLRRYEQSIVYWKNGKAVTLSDGKTDASVSVYFVTQ